MVIKNFSLAIALVCSFFYSSLNAKNVDIDKSKIIWKGSKVVGSTHEGGVKLKSGHVNFEKSLPTSAEFTVDMTSISNTDIKNPKWSAKLVKHLLSDDFFGVATFPEAKIKVNKFNSVSKDLFQLHGVLTIKGVSQAVKFKANITETNGSLLTVASSLKFDRTKFGIKYGSGSFFSNLGDKMISDEVELAITIHLDKNKKSV